MGATDQDNLSATTTEQLAPAPLAPTEPGACEQAPSRRSRSRGRPRARHSGPPQLPDPHTCETCLNARGRTRGAHAVCDECFQLHWGEVDMRARNVQTRTTRADACGCVEPGRSADPDCVVCRGGGRMGLGRLTRILTRKVDGRTVAYHVAQSMRPAKRSIDIEGQQAIEDLDLEMLEDLSKKSEHRVGLRDDDAEAFLRAVGATMPSKPRGAPATTVTDRQRIEELALLVKRMTDEAFPDNPEKAAGYAGITLLGFLNPSIDTLAEILHGEKGRSRASLFRLRKRSEQRLLDLLEPR